MILPTTSNFLSLDYLKQKWVSSPTIVKIICVAAILYLPVRLINREIIGVIVLVAVGAIVWVAKRRFNDEKQRTVINEKPSPLLPAVSKLPVDAILAEIERHGGPGNVQEAVIYFKTGTDVVRSNFNSDKLSFKDFFKKEESHLTIRPTSWYVVSLNKTNNVIVYHCRIDNKDKELELKISSSKYNVKKIRYALEHVITKEIGVQAWETVLNQFFPI